MSPNPQFPADFVRFTEEIPNGKLNFCAVKCLFAGENIVLVFFTKLTP